MPGRLLLQEDSAPRSQEIMEPSGRSYIPTSSKLAYGMSTSSLEDGAAASPKPELGASGATLAQGNAVIPAYMQEKLKHLPPEILQITEGYAPLDRLFQRTAQESFNSLLEMLSDLRKMDSTSSRQVNGSLSSHPPPSNVSVDKRLRWLETAHNSRQRLMKLSVLLQWAQSSRQPLGRLVDLFGWIRGKIDADLEATDGLGLIKKDGSKLQLLEPDLRTASRLLNEDSIDQTTIDPAYVAEPALTVKHIQQNYQRLNTALQIRLNVHEDLPRHLQDFTIQAGRVTFRYAGNFEFDLSILDEEPPSNFFFIDLRFLFTPSTEIPAGEMRFYVDTGTNHYLQSQGLIKCYDFILDFVLSYKLIVLTRQAQALARSSWSGSLNVELIHRSLILRYWAGTAAKRSWIEIGVRSANKANTGYLDEPKPRLEVKWMPYGVARTVEGELDFDHTDLDLEDVLNQVVSLHTHLLLETTFRKLREPKAPIRPINARLLEDTEGVDCSLLVPLYSTSHAKVRIEPTSGSFAIAPVDPTNQETARMFGSIKQPLDELHQRISLWRSQDAKVTLRQKAQPHGWEPVDHRNLDADTRRRNFGDADATIVFMRKWQSPRWFVAAFPQGDAGFRFSLVEIKDPDERRKDVDGFKIVSSRVLTQAASLPSSDVFEQLQDAAVAHVSRTAVTEKLRQLKLSFDLAGDARTMPVLKLQLPAAGVHPDFSNTLILSVERDLGMRRAASGDDLSTYWTLQGIIELTPSQATMLSEIQSSTIKIGAKGEVSLYDQAPLGSTAPIDRILGRLRQLSRLYSYLIAIDGAKSRLEAASLDRLSFDYAMEGSSPQSATLHLKHEAAASPQLLLSPSSNPHQRLVTYLNALLRGTDDAGQYGLAPTGAARLPFALHSTLPLMQAFDQIEKGQPHCNIQVLDLQRYRVLYDQPRCRLAVGYQELKEDAWCCIEDEAQHPINTHLRQALDKFYRQKGQDVMPLGRGGIAVRLRAVEDVLVQLDQVIRSCAQHDPPAPAVQQTTAGKPRPMPAQVNQPPAAPQLQVPQYGVAQPDGRQQPPSSSQPMQLSRSQGQIPPQTQHHRPGPQPMQQSRSSGSIMPFARDRAMPNGHTPQQFQGQTPQMQRHRGTMVGAPGYQTPNGQNAGQQRQPPNHQQQEQQNRLPLANGQQNQPQGQGQRPPQMQPYVQHPQTTQAQGHGQKRPQQDNAPEEGRKKKQKNVIEID